MSTLRSRQAKTRAASTTAALLLAAAVVSGLTVLSSSFLESVEGQVSSSITADLVVDSATFTKGGLSSDLIPLLRQQPGVAAVSGWRPGAAYVGTPLWRAGGVDGASVFSLLDLDVEGPTPSSFAPNEIVVSERLANDASLNAGDAVPVTFQNGVTTQMTVKAVFRSQLSILVGDVLVDTTVLAQNLPQSTDVLAFVDLAPGAPAGVRGDLTKLARRYGAANVLRPDQLVSTRAELLRGFARVIQWMLSFSIVLALIGVANTLQLGVNERRRELGLLRAVGATRAQVLRLVMAEAAALSLVGTIVGLALGVGAARAAVGALSDYGLDQFVAPLPTLAVVAVVAIGLGLVGAVVPALRASSVPLLEAINDRDDARPAGRRAARAATSPAPPSTPRTAVIPPPVDGRSGDPTAIVGSAPPPLATVVATTRRPEVKMALRCYNCGNEPGEGETCIACGAAQGITHAGIFGARPEPDVVDLEPEPLVSTVPTSTVAHDDIVDAAVVEDGVVVNGVVVEPGAATMPPPYEPPVTYAVEPNESTERPGGSIFESRPTPSEAHDPMRSPFGQHASEPAEATEPVEAPAPPTVRHGIFTAGTLPPEEAAPAAAPAPTPSTMMPTGATVPPPAYRLTAPGPAANGIPAGTNGGGVSAAGPGFTGNGGAVDPGNGFGTANGYGAGFTQTSAPATLPDSHGLAASVARLSPAAQANGLVPFSIAGALLAPDERVLGAVAGTSLGMATVVVVTETRALVVSDRRYVPDVELFELGPHLQIHGRHANGQASLTFSVGDRLVTVDQILDVGIAVELANVARTRTAGAEF